MILDSGFCVLSGIIVLKKMGVYASALIKKRRYWPKYIKGQEINDYFRMEELGATMRLQGMLAGVKFDVFAMNEPEYVMMLMSAYGCLSVKLGQKESVRENEGDVKKFKYTEMIVNHSDYCGAVDFHNAKRHDG